MSFGLTENNDFFFQMELYIFMFTKSFENCLSKCIVTLNIEKKKLSIQRVNEHFQILEKHLEKTVKYKIE